jgi:Skp family chaperone for outer membrane proteins
MSISKMQGMLGILERELCALIDVVVKVDPQAASTFNRNLREQMQKLAKEDKKMKDAMDANMAKIQALLDEKEALLDRTEASLDRTKALLDEKEALLDEMKVALDMQKRLQDEREARIAQREAELGLSVISNLTDMAQA